MSLYQYVTGTALVLLFICTGTVGTVGTLVTPTLCLCTNMLLVPHWYCCLYVLVLWVLLIHWYQPLYVSVPICYWYCTGTGLYMYWYCGYCWYIDTSHSMSLYQYITGTALVRLFIFTGTVGTVGTLVPATLCLCAYMLLVPHWYCSSYVLVLWVLLVHWYQPLYVSVPICYWYCTGTAVYMYSYCGYCWYIGTSHSCLCAYVTGATLVLLFICTGQYHSVQLVHWYQPLYVSVPIYYWYCTGTALYMYLYCGYCWYISTSHSMSLCLYVTGTTLVLLFICTGTVGTVGTLVPTTPCLCTNMLLVLHWYCCLYVLVLLFICTGTVGTVGTLVPVTHVSVPMLLVPHWYCSLYVLVSTIQYCWYTGTSHSISLYQYVTGTALVLVVMCTGTVGTVGTLVPATLCLCTNMLLVLHWYCTGTALYMHWYCGYYWYTGTSHSISLYQYATGTALVLLFICTGTVGTVGTLVPATLCRCSYTLLVPHWYCSLYVLVLWVLLVH